MTSIGSLLETQRVSSDYCLSNATKTKENIHEFESPIGWVIDIIDWDWTIPLSSRPFIHTKQNHKRKFEYRDTRFLLLSQASMRPQPGSMRPQPGSRRQADRQKAFSTLSPLWKRKVAWRASLWAWWTGGRGLWKPAHTQQSVIGPINLV